MTSDADLSQQPWLSELFELAPRLIRVTDATLRQLTPPITYRQFRLLERVAEGHTTLTEIGRVATLSLPAISEALDVLARKELIQRQLDGDDRRSSRLLLTPQGEQALHDGRKSLTEVSRDLLRGVPPEEWEHIPALLQQVNERAATRLRGDG